MTGVSKVGFKERSEMVMILFYKDHPGNSEDGGNMSLGDQLAGLRNNPGGK